MIRFRFVLIAISGIVVVTLVITAVSIRQNVMEPKIEVLPRPVPPRDLEDIIRSGELRILTRNNAQSYFLFRGKQMGFEYELAEEFARRHGVKIRAVVPPEWTDLIPWLLEGKGDLIASAMTATPTRAVDIRFTVPYRQEVEVSVARKGMPELKEVAELAGRTIHVREGSSYEATLLRLKERTGLDFTIDILPPWMETSDIIAEILEGTIDLTLADQSIAFFERTYSDDIVLSLALTGPQPIAWGVRPDAPDLLKAANDYLGSVRRTTFFNYLVKKYYLIPKNVVLHKETFEITREQGVISRYDTAIKAAAGHYGFDWLLIASQIFQESRFDANRESWAGAIGLTQLLPGTAWELGVEDPWDPVQNINGGVRYLKRMYDQFETAPETDRLSLALASYCAGLGHVLDARALAREHGRDADSWAGNVEEFLLKLSKPKYYQQAKHGYARGSEAVNYANDIIRRWNAYQVLLGENGPTASASKPALAAN